MNYVLDTNVLLHDPNAIFAFDGEDVYIPLYVFDELDKFKKEMTQRGKSTREIIRKIEVLREQGSLFDGVNLGEKHGKLYVKYAKSSHLDIPFEDANRIMDNAILATAKSIEEETKQDTVFITMDVNLRLRADALGLKVMDYHGESPKKIEELYSGLQTIYTSPQIIDDLYKNGEVPSDPNWNVYPNEFVLLKVETQPSKSAIGRHHPDRNVIKKIDYKTKQSVGGIRPRNKEQAFAFNLLLDETIKVVTLVGKAGTGKTLLAIAAGISMLEDHHTKYKALVVSRPIFPMGKELGFLPGDVESKLNPWMQPIFDNLDLISHERNGLGHSYKELIEENNIKIEPLTYIRGRSLPQQYIIVDEAQNLTPHEVKTIITRCGDHTKIILTGDPYQIDNPYVDSTNNGLSYVVERFKGQEISAHITLQKGERSKLAEMASNLL